MDFGSWNGGLGRGVGNLAIHVHAYQVIIIIVNPVQGPTMVIPIFCVKSTSNLQNWHRHYLFHLSQHNTHNPDDLSHYYLVIYSSHRKQYSSRVIFNAVGKYA